MRDLSDAMLDTATNLAVYGGKNKDMQTHSRQLIAGSEMVFMWADGLESKNDQTN